MARYPASGPSGLMSYQEILNAWEKCSNDVRGLLAIKAELLAACKAAVAMDDSAHCDNNPRLTADVRDGMVAAIAKAKGDQA